MNNLTFEEYQDGANETAIYPDRHLFEGLMYCVLKLNGEAGEIAEKVGKLFRDKARYISPEDVADLSKEVGDVLWYLSQICTELDISFEETAIQNYIKLKSRQERGTIQGSGDDR